MSVAVLSQYEVCMDSSKVEDSVHNICTQQTESNVANPNASLDNNLWGRMSSKGEAGPSKGRGEGVDNESLKKNVKTANYITFLKLKNINPRVSKFLDVKNISTL